MSFPNYVQLDSMDCGPTCLRIIAAFYGKRYSLQNLREKCHITREGVSLLGISDAAEAIGFRTAGVKLTWEQLRDEANLPCVVHWNQHHFVVIYKVEKHRGQWWVYISDPASGLLKYSEAQFKKSWLQAKGEAQRVDAAPEASVGDSNASNQSTTSKASVGMLATHANSAIQPTYSDKPESDSATTSTSVAHSAHTAEQERSIHSVSHSELSESQGRSVSPEPTATCSLSDGRDAGDSNASHSDSVSASISLDDSEVAVSPSTRSEANPYSIMSDKGIVLLLEPTPEFYRENGDEDKRLKFSYLLQYLRPYKGYLVQLALAMLVASILGLILPFLTQSVVDTGIGTGNLSFVVMILIAQVVLTLGQMANDLIRSWLMLHMTTRISISLISDFLAKLMRLPIAFFDSKMVGDIMQRIGDYSRIQSFLTGSLLSIAMAAVSLIIYSIVMAGYNLTILGVFLLGSVLYVGWILIFMKRRRKLDYMRFQEASANQSNIVQLIGGMQDIKLNNCEKQKRWEWERIQARLFQISIKGLTLGQTQEVGGTFIDQTKNVIISFLAAAAVIEGNMTLGMMVAMQYVIGQLNAPISQFIGFVQATQDAKISLERLNEIQEKPDEEPTDTELLREIPESADIAFRQVVFQYAGPHSPKVLDHIDLRIPHNKVTAIVGESGSGKTTMLKMMLGFYAPVEGDVMLGNRKLTEYSPSAWRMECGTVMQEGFIFSDTIAGNIGVSDEVPDMKRVRRAVEIANIGEFIDQLPLGYNTKIGADGNGLSTGQKQRLLIARAAYKDAKYLFFDEATNSLDANNERTIMERLERLFSGKTVVIVAHRLSTVKNADNIVVLAHGQIVEQGTHAALIAQKGYYYELVKNQLELGN